MSDGNVKQLRKQLRTIVGEMLPAVLTEELIKAVAQSLSEELKRRMDALESTVLKNTKEMNERQKDALSYLVRQVSTSNTEIKKDE